MDPGARGQPMKRLLLILPFVVVAQEKSNETKTSEPKLEPVRTSITVVERVEAEAPASISVVGHRELQEIPGINVDDRLRSIPGFSLFRRSSSVVANPTTQGVSLRGIGSTGVSRTLVMWDGIPVNDPFGGWIYWTRISPEELERVEISRGAATSVFGDRALGGAIGLFSREPEHRRIYGRYESGNKNTHEAGAGYSHLWSKLAASFNGRAYTTDGYFVVPENRRGTVDTRAGVRFVAADARFDYLGTSDRVFFKTDILGEERQNGTQLQTNSTGLGNVGVHYRGERAGQTFSVLGFHTREEFRAIFSSIAANRNSEALAFRQTVPSDATGGAALWGTGRRAWNVLAGADVFRVEGYSTDSLAAGGQRVGGGTMLQHGVFTQGDFTAGPARFFLGARHHVTGQDRSFFSPSAGLVVGRGRVRARGSVYRSFRAPTLNELYREFRVGNAITQANPALKPESVFGSEFGFDFVGEATRARVTFFRNDLRNLVTNVTLSTGATIIRQRQNAAAALSRGMELDTSGRWRDFRGEASYLFVDSRFVTGARVPQVARHQGSAQVSWEKNRTHAAVGLRSFALQFEDELNTALLPGFATVQFLLRHKVSDRLSAIAAFENLLDRQYLTGFTPVPLIGAPRLWRIGLRWEGRL